MKDIAELRVLQIRIYPIDILPISALLLEKNLTQFRETLRFKNMAPTEDKAAIGLVFQGGEFEHEGRTHLVDKLQIEPQRILLSVFGTSATAEAVYDEVRKILAAVEDNGRFAKAKPYVKTEETSCIVTLNVDFRRLFSPALIQFLNKTVRGKTSMKIADAKVTPSNFAAIVTYRLADAESEKGFQLVPKTLIIEPRLRTTLEERRYFTQSPTDSETHLFLLREFEKALKEPKK